MIWLALRAYLDDVRWRKSEPLAQRDILEHIGLEDFEIVNSLVADILNAEDQCHLAFTTSVYVCFGATY